MVRAAAKNHAHVGIVVDPADYDDVLAELRADGALSDGHPPPPGPGRLRPHGGLRRRDRRLARRDGPVAEPTDADPLPADAAPRPLDRRQDAALRREPPPGRRPLPLRGRAGWWDAAVQHGGKEMSYLNVYDTEAAWRLVHSLGDGPAAVVIKHANPCGAAVADDITDGLHAGPTSATRCRPSAASSPSTGPCPRRWPRRWPRCSPRWSSPRRTRPTRSRCSRPRRTCGCSRPRPPGPAALDAAHHRRRATWCRPPTRSPSTASAWKVVTKVGPTEDEWRDLELAWQVVAQVTSNTIVLVKDGQAVGIGCGQQNRRDAGRIAAEKADGRAARRRVRHRRLLPVPRRPRRRDRGRRHRRRPARRLDPRRRGHRRRRRARPRHGLHRRAPLPPLMTATATDTDNDGTGGGEVRPISCLSRPSTSFWRPISG